MSNQKSLPKKVLIIETNSSLKQYYTNNVLKLGLDPKIVTGVEDAYDFLESNFEGNLVLVVMDWVIQGANGFVVAQRIKNDPKFFETSFIICATGLTPEDKALMQELEITTVLPKGASSQVLIDTIKKSLAEQSRLSGLSKMRKQLEHSIALGNLAEVDILLSNQTFNKSIFQEPSNAHLASEIDLLRKKYHEARERILPWVDTNARGFESQSKQDANILKCLSVLGKTYLLLGNYEEAEKVFQQLSKLSPMNLLHKINEADSLVGQNKTDSARKKLSDVMDKDTKNPQALASMGASHVIDGKPELAAEYFNKISGTYESPTFAALFNNRGVGLVQGKKNEEAIQLYENALNFMKKERVSVMFNLGMAYLRAGKKEEAVSLLEEVLKTAKPEFIARKSVLKKLQELGKKEFIRTYGMEIID
jgi:tetratricopeptide (TPR) repeat protein